MHDTIISIFMFAISHKKLKTLGGDVTPVLWSVQHCLCQSLALSTHLWAGRSPLEGLGWGRRPLPERMVPLWKVLSSRHRTHI